MSKIKYIVLMTTIIIITISCSGIDKVFYKSTFHHLKEINLYDSTTPDNNNHIVRYIADNQERRTRKQIVRDSLYRISTAPIFSTVFFSLFVVLSGAFGVVFLFLGILSLKKTSYHSITDKLLNDDTKGVIILAGPAVLGLLIAIMVRPNHILLTLFIFVLSYVLCFYMYMSLKEYVIVIMFFILSIFLIIFSIYSAIMIHNAHNLQLNRKSSNWKDKVRFRTTYYQTMVDETLQCIKEF